jgi:hypothetical protein
VVRAQRYFSNGCLVEHQYKADNCDRQRQQKATFRRPGNPLANSLGEYIRLRRAGSLKRGDVIGQAPLVIECGRYITRFPISSTAPAIDPAEGGAESRGCAAR